MRVALFLTFIVFAGVITWYFASRVRARAISQDVKIHWVFSQAERALTLIHSVDHGEILIGLQMLSVFNIPTIRMKAFLRLAELAKSPDRQVADLANHVIRLAEMQNTDAMRTSGVDSEKSRFAA